MAWGNQKLQTSVGISSFSFSFINCKHGSKPNECMLLCSGGYIWHLNCIMSWVSFWILHKETEETAFKTVINN